MMTDKAAAKHSWKKMALEMGPVLLFFLLNNKFDLMVATAGFMVASIVSLVLSKVIFKKIAVMPLVGGFLVLIFGGLTLLLDNEIFIKIKPTVINLFFGIVLLVAQLVFKRPLIKLVMAEVASFTDQGWRTLSLMWGFYFLFLATVNEVVWRNFDTDTWVAFKTFGILPVTILFTIMLLPVMKKHMISTT